MWKISIVLLSLILILFCCLTAQTQGRSTTNQSPESTRLPYAIVLNEVHPEDKDTRQVIVLQKKESFTRDNLVQILRLIEIRYPKPGGIILDFYTDLEDIETPEERDGPHMTRHKATKDEEKRNKGDYAFFVRISKNKYGNCLMYFADGRFQEVKIK